MFLRAWPGLKTYMHFFDSSHARTRNVADQPSSYQLPLPNHQYTHHALIVCSALRRACPCDDDRDTKEDDRDIVFLMSDQFSGKQLRNATICAEKREAIDQCPGWIVFSVCGLYARGLLG